MSSNVPAVQSDAVAAYVAQGLSAISLRDAGLSDGQAFRASAVATFRAREAGVSAPLLAKAFREASTAWKAQAVAGTTYTSPESVGYHAATGRLFSLAGDLPEGMTPREAQTVVRTTRDMIGARMVDEMLRNADSQADVLAALAGKRDKAQAAKAQAAKAEAKAEADAKAAGLAALAAAAESQDSQAAALAEAEAHADAADEADEAGTPDRTVADSILAESGDILAETLERAMALVDAGVTWSPRAVAAMQALVDAAQDRHLPAVVDAA